MGRTYYCEYCNKSFREISDSIKKHRSGLAHQKQFKDHYHKFRDKATILLEESAKRPCNNFHNNQQCNFGAICRFSHFTSEQLGALRWEVEQSRHPSLTVISETPTLQTWFTSRRERGLEDSATLEKAFLESVFTKDSDVTSLMCWKYPETLDNVGNLPPSIMRLKGEDFKDVEFAEWG